VNSDLAALLAALRDCPEDEVARLALADWCLEQPEPALQARGEHLRLHARRAALAYNQPEYRSLSERIRALECGHRRAWLGAPRRFAHRCDFVPGGLVRVEVSDGRLAQVIPKKPAPLAREDFVWVTTVESRTPLTMEHLRWLSAYLPEAFLRGFSASVARPGGPEAVRVLAGSAWVEGLRVLNLRGSGLGDVGTRVLAGTARLACLQSLDLARNGLERAGLKALADSEILGRLCGLSVPGNALGADAGVVVGGARWGANLQQLNLSSCSLGREGLRRLTASWLPQRLQVLHLNENSLNAAAAECLAGWPALNPVTHLSLNGNLLGDEGVAALAGSPYVGRLRTLDLSATGLGDEGLRALARSTSLIQLEELHLAPPFHTGSFTENRMTAAGFQALVDGPGLPALRVLRGRVVRLPAPLEAALARRFPG
jgi:uncharacterized protein (TIGR02996 family)